MQPTLLLDAWRGPLFKLRADYPEYRGVAVSHLRQPEARREEAAAEMFGRIVGEAGEEYEEIVKELSEQLDGIDAASMTPNGNKPAIAAVIDYTATCERCGRSTCNCPVCVMDKGQRDICCSCAAKKKEPGQ